MTAEHERLGDEQFRLWGPYVSERAWGTVREDYSAGGDAWSAFPHDHARSRAYRWNEDGLAGICDSRAEPVPGARDLERARPDPQGAHLRPRPATRATTARTPRSTGGTSTRRRRTRGCAGATTTRSGRSRTTTSSTVNRRRGRHEPEYELLDTGVFDDDRYFEITVDIAKAAPDDILIGSGAQRRSRRGDARTCCRRCGSATRGRGGRVPSQPVARAAAGDAAIVVEHHELGPMVLAGDGGRGPAVLRQRDQRAAPVRASPATAYPEGRRSTTTSSAARDTVNPDQVGTKAALRYRLDVARRRQTADAAPAPGAGGRDVADLAGRLRRRRARRRERGRRVLRRAHARPTPPPTRPSSCARRFAGMLWTQAVLQLRRRRWLDGDPAGPPPPAERTPGATPHWRHIDNFDVISMPDKWEYPWYAAWDSAFHCVALAHVDPEFAKEPAAPAPARVVPAPQRPDPGLRVGLRRRQPAGARVGRAAGLRDRRPPRLRSSSPRCSRSCSSTSRGGSTGRTTRATTCSRAASSGSTTSARSTAPRTCPSGGTSSRATARPGWRCTASTCCAIALDARREGPDLRGHRVEVLRALRPHRRRATQRPRGCGTSRTASSTTSCTSRTARACRCGSARWSGLSPLYAARVIDERGARRFPGFATRRRWFLGTSRADADGRDLDASTTTASAELLLSVVGTERLRADPGGHARRGASSSPRTACGRCLAPPPRAPTAFAVDGPSSTQRRLRAGRVAVADVRRQLELARARSGSRSTS